jgi:hypothetical protein
MTFLNWAQRNPSIGRYFFTTYRKYRVLGNHALLVMPKRESDVNMSGFAEESTAIELLCALLTASPQSSPNKKPYARAASPGEYVDHKY